MIVVWPSAGEGCAQVCGGDIGEDPAQHGGPDSGPGAGQVARPRAGPHSRRRLWVSLIPSHPLPSTPSLPHTLSPLPHSHTHPHISPTALPLDVLTPSPQHTLTPSHLTPSPLTPSPRTTHLRRYSNIFVMSPSPKNLRTVFQFLF